MADKIIIRGDSYGLRRPLFRIELLDRDGEPFDLTSCTIRTTYKAKTTSPKDDPNDEEAPIRHELRINSSGAVLYSAGLHLIGTAADGVIEERLTSVESRNLPVDIVLFSDIELTDVNDEKFTWIMQDGLKAIDGYTNREIVGG